MLAKLAKVEEAVNAAKQMIPRDVILKIECVKELILNYGLSHHDAHLHRWRYDTQRTR